jgi:hypothetical protein
MNDYTLLCFKLLFWEQCQEEILMVDLNGKEKNLSVGLSRSGIGIQEINSL